MKEQKSKIKTVTLLLIALCLVIAIGFGVFTLSKINIINNLFSKSTEIRKRDNYSIKINTENTNKISFVKNEDYYSESESNQSGVISITYQKANNKVYAVDGHGQKMFFKEHALIIKPVVRTIEDFIQPSEVNQKAFQGQIKSIDFENKECYEITLTKELMIIVEKDTGLVLKEVNGEETIIYTYEFDKVTDNDIQKPDLTGYTEMK